MSMTTRRTGDAPALAQVFGRIFAHRVDYADLYFQYSRSEGWSLEEGIVKSGSFTSTRASECARWRREDGLRLFRRHQPRSARRGGGGDARDRAAGRGGRGRRWRSGDAGAQRCIFRTTRSPALPTRTRSRCSRGSNAWRARATRASLRSWPSLGGEYEVVLVARSDGLLAADVRPLVRLSRAGDRRGGRPARTGQRRAAVGAATTAYFTDEVLAVLRGAAR